MQVWFNNNKLNVIAWHLLGVAVDSQPNKVNSLPGQANSKEPHQAFLRKNISSIFIDQLKGKKDNNMTKMTKNRIVSFIIMLLVFGVAACGGKAEENEEPGMFESISAIKDFADNMEDMAEELDEIEEDADVLIKATPLTNDQLKAFLPEELQGLPRRSFTVGDQALLSMATAEANYENEEGQSIDLSLMDGAGETGSAVIQMQRLGLSRDFEKQTEDGYEKSIDFEGYRGTEEYSKYRDVGNANLTVLVANRFVIALSAKDVSMEDLKKAARSLAFDELEDLAK